MNRPTWTTVLSIAAAAALLAGCGDKPLAQGAGPLPSASQSVSPPAPGASASQKAAPSSADSDLPLGDEYGEVALDWRPVTDVPAVSPLADWPSGVERALHEYKLKSHPGMKVVVYAAKADADQLYAALVAKDKAYDLGAIAGAAYKKPEDVAAEDNVEAFGQKLLKVTGTVGASATVTRYLSLAGDAPRAVLNVDSGHASETDLDFDGAREIVATAGTEPHTYVYRWNEDHAEWCDLGAALGAAATSISPESAVVAEFKANLVRLYWLDEGKLRTFGQYTSEEYWSNRFVTIPYEAGELQAIKDAAADIGLKVPYAPARGIATDYGIQATVDREQKTVQITYPHFEVRMAKHDLRPGSGAKTRKTVQLPGGEAAWIEASPGSGAWYLKRGSTYLSIYTAKPYSPDQLLFVAASLVPASDLKPTQRDW
ncbi:hypothetical protein [Cohnella sp. REN36]|uniref:hypothetical protein n=1 Tax=Cohnella sp. REN36 TaxID=2887347 RepID=UPI001D157642|nr:hypothetical protein [Cohnella sp. REN36]MCC3375219.1 hypothetical protein [Cohnella sp. REN36]